MRTDPGIGVAAALWLIAQDPMVVGADKWSAEVMPGPDPQANQPVHQLRLPVYGVHLLENMRLDDLAAKRACEFALMMQPLKIQGGTGSTSLPSRCAKARRDVFSARRLQRSD